MFNLERAIGDWRRRMIAEGIKAPVPLDELESHLREDFGAFVAAGEPDPTAFERAVLHLGDSREIRTEFGKIRTTSLAAEKIAISVLVGAMVLFGVMLLRRMATGKLSFLLVAHIFCVTAGYVTAFMMGGLAIWRAWSRRSGRLKEGILKIAGASAGLAVVGFFLGMVWCGRHQGGCWNGGAREFGGLCGTAWFVAVWAAQRLLRVSERAWTLLCVATNVVIALAWFGAWMWSAGNWPAAVIVPLALFVGFHIGFMAMAGTKEINYF
jgi:hypothetical protein